MRLSCPVPSCLTGGSGGNVFMFYARRLLKLLSVQHIPWRIVSLNFNGLKKLSAEFLVVVVVVVVAATFDRDDTRHMCAVLLCVSMCIRGYCSYVSYVKHVVGSILIKYNVCGWLPIMTRAQSFFCRFWFSGICWLETTKKEHAQIRMTQNWITFGLWHLLAVRAVIRGGHHMLSRFICDNIIIPYRMTHQSQSFPPKNVFRWQSLNMQPTIHLSLESLSFYKYF